jgi:hypothetical protein
MESVFSTVNSALADRFSSEGAATMELFDDPRCSITSCVDTRRSGRSAGRRLNDG